MSTPAEPGPAEAKDVDRRMGLGRYVKRMSSVFKREKPSKSVSPAVPAAPSAPQIEQHPVKEEATREAGAPTAPSAAQAPVPVPAITRPPAMPTVTMKQFDRNAMQQERARALFAKYGLALESHEWIAAAPIPPVQRVEKSIRMRIHRSCHRCGTIYGLEKVCLQCEHRRCKKCPRYSKTKPPVDKEKEKMTDEKPKKKRVLTITTKSGNELGYRPAKQRVRRTCHKCETLFVPPTATICEQCRHIRCTKCPREPAKLQKWPTGYPGDVDADSDSEVEKQLEKFRRTWRKPRQRVRWECEQCHNLFLNGSSQCPGCGHERCDRCTRSPIKKVKKEERFDPELVAAVEAKLRALKVDDDSPTSEPEAGFDDFSDEK